MKTFNKTALTLAIGSLVAFSATANAAKHKHHNNYENVDYARVIDVYPVTKQIKTSVPIEKCYDKKVWHETRGHHSGHGHKNEIVGAVIGAVVGNRIGKRVRGRNGRDIATAAGAVIGGVIGNGQSRKSYNRSSGYYKVVQHCDTYQDVRYEDKVVAYKVKYKYRGQVYNTRTDYHPGDRLKVRISVEPYKYS